jgi:type IV pilus assembly protein PilB
VIPHDFEFVCATPEAINGVLIQFYGDAEQLARTMERQMASSGNDLGLGEGEEGEASGEEAPIIKMVSSTLLEAFKANASDIHIEPLEADLRVRYRIDGVLHDVEHHPKKLHQAVVTRIKIMTGTMSIDEKRIPQDGRIEVKISDRQLDLRVSTVPTNHGESVVMRILDKESLKLGLSDLGFFSDDEDVFNNLITLPDGILLVTGPTGSGKTTTLYACLHTINKPDRKIITIEDPVEYEMVGINQVMVKEDIGMTFAAALRSILRQAPNIIMVGEIRDLETAQIAINASLTGHLVFSTLHTNDAPSAIARLTDIGIKPFLVASALRAIVAQRLVRKLCNVCKEPGMMTEKEMRALRITAEQLMEATVMAPAGCNKCRTTGFKGRMGIVEMFKVDDEARHMINEKLSTPRLRRRARELGMRTLREDGIRKALAGSTTAAEVLRVTMGDDG